MSDPRTVHAVLVILSLIITLYGIHLVSYCVLKRRILQRQRWDLNVCCGRTDGGGVNADITVHARMPHMVVVDVYHLPFGDRQFDAVLSSHTIEHVADPGRFFEELTRVGHDVTLVIPPLWDPLAVVNPLEHRWVFLSFKKDHKSLPRYVRLPLASTVQDLFGQRIST